MQKASPWHTKGYCRRKHWGRGKTDFKPGVSQKAEIVGSYTEKKKKRKRKGDLNRSKPAEGDKEGEEHCRHETLPAAFHRPGMANLSQEIKQRKGVRWAKARRVHGGMLSASSEAGGLSSPPHTDLWPAPDFGCSQRHMVGMWTGLDGEMSPEDSQKQLHQLCP